MTPLTIETDFLVIGSGIAGLAFALKAAASGKVTIVTKKDDYESNTNYAQGGIASVLDPRDSFEGHIEDTLEAGAGLCDRESVEILVREGPNAIRELIEWGTDFTFVENDGGEKHLQLGREGGHSFNRIVHAADLTGAAVESALLARIKENNNITIYENHTAIDLLTEHQIKAKQNKDDPIHCYGAYILDNASGTVHTILARVTLLASGGVGQVYPHTTNPSIATGDGIAMAYRAGALMADMEFIQFHPTAFYSEKPKKGPTFLISEAVRGEGALLITGTGQRLMEGKHPREDLAPRDIVARAIDEELKGTGENCVFLDITCKGKDFLQERFPHIFSYCMNQGIDISRDPIPVVPAAHYLCGGIVCDRNGHTTIRNLYVSGESACTGVHGANRLASNSLLEGVVYSLRACENASRYITKKTDSTFPFIPPWDKEGTFDLKERILVQHNMEEVRRLMWDYVGIVRTDHRLKTAYRRIILLAEEIHDVYWHSSISSHMVELRNLATAAKLIIKSAMTRQDSVGLHYNADHPVPEDKKRNVLLRSEHDPVLVKLRH